MSAIRCLDCGAVGDSDGAKLACGKCYAALSARVKALEEALREIAEARGTLIKTDVDSAAVRLLILIARAALDAPVGERPIPAPHCPARCGGPHSLRASDGMYHCNTRKGQQRKQQWWTYVQVTDEKGCTLSYQNVKYPTVDRRIKDRRKA